MGAPAGMPVGGGGVGFPPLHMHPHHPYMHHALGAPLSGIGTGVPPACIGLGAPLPLPTGIPPAGISASAAGLPFPAGGRPHPQPQYRGGPTLGAPASTSRLLSLASSCLATASAELSRMAAAAAAAPMHAVYAALTADIQAFEVSLAKAFHCGHASSD
jgi:hypothetical protein